MNKKQKQKIAVIKKSRERKNRWPKDKKKKVNKKREKRNKSLIFKRIKSKDENYNQNDLKDREM